MSPSDDLTWYHLTSSGWVIAGSFYAGDGGSREAPPRGPECLCVVLHTSPNNMYSRSMLDTLWVSPDAASVADAMARYGRVPSFSLPKR